MDKQLVHVNFCLLSRRDSVVLSLFTRTTLWHKVKQSLCHTFGINEDIEVVDVNGKKIVFNTDKLLTKYYIREVKTGV